MPDKLTGVHSQPSIFTLFAQPSVQRAWYWPVILSILMILSVLAVYFETFRELVDTWTRSGTFTHGFLIFPIAGWLIWERRFLLVAQNPRPCWLAIPVLLVLGLIWLLGHYAGVWVVQQLAVVAMIPVVVYGVVGWAAVRTIAFPLCFLAFAIPIGEELVPYLIHFTADFTTAMIHLTGIPIYREGNYFELPTGSWSVVKACSGVRYLISSVALGLLYAYLSYRSLFKRCVFVLVAVIVPIFANGLRAFMIVMIGHFSDMALATGVDHLVYGWLFFGLVIGIMFYIGSFWAEAEETPEPVLTAATDNAAQAVQTTAYQPGLIHAVMLLAVLIWPFKIWLEHTDRQTGQSFKLSMPTGEAIGLRAVSPLTGWRPVYQGVDAEAQQTYGINTQAVVSVYVGAYIEQRQDAELINSQNVLIEEEDSGWRLLDVEPLRLETSRQQLVVPSAILTSETEKLLVVFLYALGDELTSSPYRAKWLEVKNKLLGGHKSAAVISFATRLNSDEAAARQILQQSSRKLLPGIVQSVLSLQSQAALP